MKLEDKNHEQSTCFLFRSCFWSSRHLYNTKPTPEIPNSRLDLRKGLGGEAKVFRREEAKEVVLEGGWRYAFHLATLPHAHFLSVQTPCPQRVLAQRRGWG